ncbi:insulin-degrading enzyme-like isoform X1 [Hydra vulgaris]|uniref:Insulin-degrading enzyme-like isoform X1 n=2 Tax=Hydra vulgaris TaxID=6087 RepID=A0ABM4BVQ7_HYDVU
MLLKQNLDSNDYENLNQFSEINFHPYIKHKVYGIKKSENDPRDYCFLVLDNELQILLVSDQATETAAASVDVYVGFENDPDDVPGIAHFCEHMLFLGTHKYPIENEYSKFLSQNCGYSNAYTSDQHTNYYFEVKSDQLEGALDRFAQFFICPLFTESSTERELNAIHSEFQKNVFNDTRRISSVDKETSKPGHVYTKFGSGNITTLKTIPSEKNIDIRDRLLKFYETNYSANIMTLVVLGKESLIDLEKMVVSKFKDIANKNTIMSFSSEHPYSQDQLSLSFNVATIKNHHSLQLRFPMPDLHAWYKKKPEYYVSHLIGHEGEGSLLSLLKRNGWVQNLSTMLNINTKGYQFFVIEMKLTNDGLGHVTEIITAVFQYINLLKSDSAHEWMYKEIQMLKGIEFRYKDVTSPRSYVTELSSLMQQYPPDDILYGPYMMEEFSPDLIKMIIDLLTPDKFRYFVGSPNFKGEALLKTNHYDAEYKVNHIEAAQIKQWESCGLNPDLHFPDKNPFIPCSLEVKVTKKDIKNVPYIFKDTEMMRIWYKADDTFLLPKAIINLSIKSPVANNNPLENNLLAMFVEILKDELNELLYSADLAKLNCIITQTRSGIFIYIHGYDNKQHLVLLKIIEKLKELKIKEDRFNAIKESKEKSLKNHELVEPYQQVSLCSMHLVDEAIWDVDDKLVCMKDVTVKSLEEYISRFLVSIFVECLLCGNLLQDDVNAIITIMEEKLLTNAQPLFPLQHILPRTYCLNKGINYLFEKRSKLHITSCIYTLVQVGIQETKVNVLCEIITSMLHEPFYDQLRTKEQLGYIVHCGISNSVSTKGIFLLVQSDKQPSYVEKRIGIFLNDFEETILNMDALVFSDYVQSLIEKKLEKPKRLDQEALQYLSEIKTKQYHFKRGEVEAKALQSLTKEDVLFFYKKYICPSSNARKSLTIAILGKDAQSLLEDTEKKDWMIVDDVLRFKSGLGLYPLVRPYNNEIKLLGTSAKSKL